MKILVCGAGGFIGRHIVGALRANGHTVREGRSAEIDFTRELQPASWLPHIDGMEAVINAVGILRDSAGRPMNAVHFLAPQALFQACAQEGLRRVIHISALGIDDNPTLYAGTKLQAETALCELADIGTLSPTVVRPSIVFGRGGASSQLFMNLAGLPVLLLPGAALRARVQPVAVQDLAAVCAALVDAEGPLHLQAVGPQSLPLADFIASLRAQRGSSSAQVLPLPDWLSRTSARCGDYVPKQPWCSETLTLLQQDNVGDPGPFAALLSRPTIRPQNLVAESWNN